MKLAYCLCVLCFIGTSTESIANGREKVHGKVESRRMAKTLDPLTRITYRLFHMRPSRAFYMPQIRPSQLFVDRPNEKFYGDAKNSEAKHNLVDEKQQDIQNVGKGDDEKLYERDFIKLPVEIDDKTIKNNNSLGSKRRLETETEIGGEIINSSGFSKSGNVVNGKETDHESTQSSIENTSNKLITMSQLVTEVTKTIFRMGTLVNPLRGSIAGYFNTIRRSFQNGKFRFSGEVMKKTERLIKKFRKVFMINQNSPIRIRGVDKNNFQFLISKWKNGIIKLRILNLVKNMKKLSKEKDINQFTPLVSANDVMAENKEDRKMPSDNDNIENPNPIAEGNISDIRNSLSKNEKPVDHQGKVMGDKQDGTNSSNVEPFAIIREKNNSDQIPLTMGKLFL